MRRNEFIALMLSPLLAPFVKAKGVTQAQIDATKRRLVGHRHTATFIDEYANLNMTEAQRRMWLDGKWLHCDWMPYGYRQGVKTNPSVVKAIHTSLRNL